MGTVNRLDSMRASLTRNPHQEHEANGTAVEDATFELSDFEAELKKLSAANQELIEEFNHPETDAESAVESAGDELAALRRENAELRERIEDLETAPASADEQQWLDRQKEYEMLLEEKSEVIRELHLKIQEMQESALDAPPPPSPAPSGTRLGQSATRMGQAEEILRLKRELDTQRRQLDQDEQDMMAQMKQMEITMAKERAEMARQRQEVTRLQADLAREIENSSRNPELRERLNTLRRQGESKQVPIPAAAPPAAKPKDQQSSGFFRRIFG